MEDAWATKNECLHPNQPYILIPIILPAPDPADQPNSVSVQSVILGRKVALI